MTPANPLDPRATVDHTPDSVAYAPVGAVTTDGIPPQQNETVGYQGQGSARPALPLPVVAGFEILGILGCGGMGVVYKARQLKLKRLVALKMILAGAHAGSSELERFRLEAEAVASLQHPNIVQIHEIGEQDGKPYFSLEFVDGGSLQQTLAGTPLKPREAATLLETLARAMHAAHEHGVIHRDLKPANVLLMHDGVPKITDFGLAKQLGQDSGQTHSGQIIGTPSYMAPEQAAGNVHALGPATDIYALGAILYEMLTGRPPFKAASVLDTLDLVRTQEPVPPSQLQPKTPPDLETICLKCLQKDPGKRYASAADLADDVRRFLNGEPIQARPVGQLERFGRWCRRNPVVASLSAAVVFVLLTGTAVAWYLAVDAIQEKDRADGNAATAKANEEKEKLARGDADKNAAESKASERLARKRLYEARLAQAWAGRKTGEVGQRLDSLKALQEAADLAKDLGLGSSARMHLRNEVIACLGLTDLRLDKDWKAWALGMGESMPFDADVNHYAVCNGEGNISVRRTSDNREEAFLPPPAKDRLPHFSFSPDGNLLLAQSSTAVIWDWRKKTILFRAPSVLAFSPDSKLVALGRGQGKVAVVELSTGREIHALTFRSRSGGYAFSPDGTKLALGSMADRQVEIREVASDKLLRQFAQPSGADDLAWHPNGRLLAVSSNDFHIHLWNVETGQEHAVLRGHQALPHGLCFSASGERLSSWSWDGTVRLWDTWAGRELLRVPGVYGRLSHDGRRLALRKDAQIQLWEVIGDEYHVLPTWEGLARADIHNTSFRLSPDGRWLAVGGSQGLALLDFAHRRLAAFLPVPGMEPDVAFHPSGREFWFTTTGGIYRTSLHMEKETLKIGPVQSFYAGYSRQIAFASNGKVLAIGRQTGSPLVFNPDLPANKPRSLPHANGVNVAVSPDGRWVATGNHHGSGVKVWDAASGQLVHAAHKESYFARVVFRPDGRQLAALNQDAITFWETGTWKEQRRVPPGNLAWSPKGDLLALSHSAYDVTLEDAATGATLATLAAPDGLQVGQFAFSPDGDKLLLMARRPAYVRVWDLRRVRQELAKMGLDWDAPAYAASKPTPAAPLRVEVDLGEPAPANTPLGKIVFSQPGELDAKTPLDKSGRHQKVHTFKMKVGNLYTIDAQSKEFDTYLRLADSAGKLLKEDDDGGGDLNARIVFRPGSDSLYRIVVTSYKAGVTGAYTLTIREAPAPPRDPNVLELQAHVGTVSALGFSPDGARLVTGDSKTARMWDAKSGKLLFPLDVKGPIVRASFGAGEGEGDRLLTVSSKETAVRLWDAQTGKALPALPELKGIVRDAVFTPDGKRIVCADASGTLTVFDVAAAKVLSAVAVHDPKLLLNGLTVSPDGGKVCFAMLGQGMDRLLIVWNLDTGKEALSWPASMQPIYGVAWSADGKWIASTGLDQTVHVWHAATGKSHKSLSGPAKAGSRVALDKSGKRVAATSQDGAVRVWDIDTGKLDAQFPMETQGIGGNVAFSPDGRRLAATAPGIVQIWDLPALPDR